MDWRNQQKMVQCFRLSTAESPYRSRRLRGTRKESSYPNPDSSCMKRTSHQSYGCPWKAANCLQGKPEHPRTHSHVPLNFQAPVSGFHWPNPSRSQKTIWSVDAVVMGQLFWLLSKMERSGRQVKRDKKISSILTHSRDGMHGHQLWSWVWWSEKAVTHIHGFTHLTLALYSTPIL